MFNTFCNLYDRICNDTELKKFEYYDYRNTGIFFQLIDAPNFDVEICINEIEIFIVAIINHEKDIAIIHIEHSFLQKCNKKELQKRIVERLLESDLSKDSKEYVNEIKL